MVNHTRGCSNWLNAVWHTESDVIFGIIWLVNPLNHPNHESFKTFHLGQYLIVKWTWHVWFATLSRIFPPKTHEKNPILQQCTPWKVLRLLPCALLPGPTAALSSSIGFTVMKCQAVPKANRQSQLRTCSDGHLIFSDCPIDSINSVFSKRHAVLFSSFPKPSSTSTGLHDPPELCGAARAPCNGMLGHQWPCIAALLGSKDPKQVAPPETKLVFLRMKHGHRLYS